MAEDRGPKVLLGDFNAEPGAPELAPLWAELTDAGPEAPTFPAQDPVKRIDYVVMSKTAQVRRACGTGERRLGPPGGRGGPGAAGAMRQGRFRSLLCAAP
ncbi:hypothetical protein SMICM17S_01865 [Streptomyces microflavus]